MPVSELDVRLNAPTVRKLRGRCNIVFLEGVKAALTADPAWQDGWFAMTTTAGISASTN
jgi:hypothetical protein